MRRVVLIAAAVLAAVVALALYVSGDGDGDSRAGDARPAAADSRTVEAGAVTVKIERVRLDAAGAEFKLTFDTQSVALDLDVARNATLTVGGAAWGGPTWSGAGPGGHHREGTVRFTAGRGPATGPAVLTITGLPEPVRATWTVEG